MYDNLDYTKAPDELTTMYDNLDYTKTQDELMSPLKYRIHSPIKLTRSCAFINLIDDTS